MRIAKLMSAGAAVSLIMSPIMAQAATQPARVGSDVRDAESLHGGWLIPLLALAAVILGIIVLVDNNDDTLPHSP